MVGIYKITNPKLEIYIGQSIDIERRWKSYKRKYGHNNIRESFNIFGLENHKFEIIHQLPKDVSQDILNEYEILYIQKYKECGVKLLNITSGGQGGIIPKEIKEKISKTLNGRTLTEEHKQKIRDFNKGKKISEETKEKMRKAYKGAKFYNNGKVSIMIKSDIENIPDGFKLGKLHKDEIGKKHYNNKIIGIMINPLIHDIPEGFFPGRLKWKNK